MCECCSVVEKSIKHLAEYINQDILIRFYISFIHHPTRPINLPYKKGSNPTSPSFSRSEAKVKQRWRVSNFLPIHFTPRAPSCLLERQAQARVPCVLRY